MSSVESAKIPDIGMPAVSVIIPTFNRSKLVVNAIESVLAQTYRDYEIIVVDDGSTDNTAEALKPYMGRICYVYQANLGTSAAKNKGIQVARGKWISVLDSDDLWLPTKLEAQLKAVATLGKDFGACFTNCDFFGTTHVIPSAFEQAGLDEELPFGPLKEPFKILLARYPAIYVQSLLVLRSLIEYPNGYDERLVVTEDTDLLFRLAFKTKFCFVNERLVKIDRTPSREVGLMELFYKDDDLAFASRQHLLQKWICLVEDTDPGLRRTLEELLKGMYYSWLVTKLYRFRYVKAFEIAGRIKATGDNNKTICRALASRAKRKISSLVNQFHNS
jgi:glycosyltransferase involved in cell wall biosynthesis